MQIWYSQVHEQHNPPILLHEGKTFPYNETPDRIDNIKKALSQEGHIVTLPALLQLIPDELLRRIHSQEYITFLDGYHKYISDDEYRIPFVFGPNIESRDLKILQGKYTYDTYTPLSRMTPIAAFDAATLTYNAALELTKLNQDITNPPSIYVLTRPPGHHASREQMAGYCYLNNAAIAADTLIRQNTNKKVAILDVDFHHGNGTQSIFYERSDVTYFSLHASPNTTFPYISGREREIGTAAGEGYNHNFIVPAESRNTEYDNILDRALGRLQEHHPDFLVLSLGFDTHINDPIGSCRLTTEYYREMGQKLASLGLPTLIVQEGGYNVEMIGENAVSFVKGFVG